MANNNKRYINPDRLVININDLPSLPTVIADTLRVINDPRSSALEIEGGIL